MTIYCYCGYNCTCSGTKATTPKRKRAAPETRKAGDRDE